MEKGTARACGRISASPRRASTWYAPRVPPPREHARRARSAAGVGHRPGVASPTRRASTSSRDRAGCRSSSILTSGDVWDFGPIDWSQRPAPRTSKYSMASPWRRVSSERRTSGPSGRSAVAIPVRVREGAQPSGHRGSHILLQCVSMVCPLSSSRPLSAVFLTRRRAPSRRRRASRPVNPARFPRASWVFCIVLVNGGPPVCQSQH